MTNRTNLDVVVELQAWLATLEPVYFMKFWYAVAMYQARAHELGEVIELADCIIECYAEIQRMIADGLLNVGMKPVGTIH